MIISKNANEVAEAMGLPASKALEWTVRHQLTERIGQIIKTKKWTIAEVAKLTGTSRVRMTGVIKGNTEGLSIDILLRILKRLEPW